MTNKSKKILSEVSAGELLDKISILEIKLVKIKNENDLNFIKKEYEILKKTQDTFIKTDDEILSLFNMLKDINLKLWNIEDKLRICEKNEDFKEEFVKLAREVYLTNDKRANIKLKINTILGSDIREIKQYIKY
jgi:adenine C2-methylase RlmN of 23S rRNA A2503 and tRNA A37